MFECCGNLFLLKVLTTWMLKAKEKGRSSGMSQREKGTAGQHIDSSPEQHSKKRG